jgi:methylisocitrate lyase
MITLRQMIAEGAPVFAPLVLNPLMARMAEKAGARAIYLGGGASGYQGIFTEANLSLTEMAHAGLEIGTACRLPLILDGACGWGDPMQRPRDAVARDIRLGFVSAEGAARDYGYKA